MRRKSGFITILIWVAVGTFFSTQIKDILSKVPIIKDIFNKTNAA